MATNELKRVRRPDPDTVICPACAHDFEAISVNVQAELARLRDEVATLVWNLGGISTMACRRTPIDYNREVARPALDEVAELVKDYARLRAVNAELVGALHRIANTCENFVGCPVGPQTIAEVARAAISRAEQAKPEPETETCVWKYGIDKDGWDGWYTTCGGFISFSAKRPEGYQQQGYCHFCGRRIEVKK